MKGELQGDPVTLIQHISYCQGVGSNPKPPMNQTTLLEAAHELPVPKRYLAVLYKQHPHQFLLSIPPSQAVPTFSLKGKGAQGITWHRNAAATINKFPFVLPVNKHFRLMHFCLR